MSSLKCGLLPVCDEAMACLPVSYYEYGGLDITPSEQAKLGALLGPTNKVCCVALRAHA